MQRCRRALFPRRQGTRPGAGREWAGGVPGRLQRVISGDIVPLLA